MTLFVDEFIRQTKLFCTYCIIEDAGIQNPFTIYKMLAANSSPHDC